jgi:penicillin-binding protein 1A
VLRGHGVIGIAHASAAYFRKKPSQLDVGEAALLAGLLPAPEYLSPYKNAEAAKRVRNQVHHSFLARDKATTATG